MSDGGATPSAQEIRELVAAVVAGVHEAAPGERPRSREHPDSATPVEPEGGTRRSNAGDVAVGADHGGFALKERIRKDLEDHGFSVVDCGTSGTEAVDYPDLAHEVARLVAHGDARWGIVVDGAGIGSCMAANKVPGIRAAACWDISSARNSREHNHANVLTLGAGLIGENLALQIVQAWLSTPWGGDRHARRVEKIMDIERRHLAAGAAR